MNTQINYTASPQPQTAHITAERYDQMYQRSITDTAGFWADMAQEHVSWFKKWDVVDNCNFDEPRIEWFKGGKLNVAYNCIDRHLESRADQTAIIWEADSPEEPARHITYKELHEEVSKLANVLKSMGVEKGDRVSLYMPMVPEAAFAMLACARIGAVHSIVFAGFSATALKDRIEDSACKVVLTSDQGFRGGRVVNIKETVDTALEEGAKSVEKVLVLQRTGADVPMVDGRDLLWHEEMAKVSAECVPEEMDSLDPLFILYTSGSTGKPKGVLHGTGGYMVYASTTHKYSFDHQEGDVFWCTADVGWITGHTYVVYAPLCNGGTTVMFEGVPQYPEWSRFWDVCDKFNVTTLYTAPTAIRAIQAQGDEHVKKTSRKSLRLLGSVGEPINPEAWNWFYNVVGEGRCRVVDTYWQTECGGHILAPLPYASDSVKPGCATRPFFGIKTVMLDDKGNELDGAGEGCFCITHSWPGQMMSVYGNHERFKQTYFSNFEGKYFSGDGCRRDADGDIWITGRMDDIINVSGHRIGTAEVESALVLHPEVAEAAVVGVPHDVKGEGIYAYVTLHKGKLPSEDLRQELVRLCTKEIGPIAKPDAVQWSRDLPKTRSGKIMRRILRKIASQDTSNLGDVSTLADPSVVTDLIEERLRVQI